MKKILSLFSFIILSVGIMTAQNTKTVTGYVVDTNGSPISGAEVMAPGGGATVITDADGSFSIEVHPLLKKLTASYAGMADKSLSLKDTSNLVFTMKREPKLRGFISAVGTFGFDFYQEIGQEGAGLMGGQLGKWGWYSKLLMDNDGGDNGFNFTAGAIKQFGKKPTYLYFGVGWAYDGWADYSGVGVDLGVIFKVKTHLNVITGINFNYIEDATSLNANIGIGYTF